MWAKLRDNLVIYGPPIFFCLPGMLLIAGGRSAPLGATKEPPRDMVDLLGRELYPDRWWTLLVCAGLICLPGWAFYAGAGYLAEVTFARVPLQRTPEAIWHVVGFLLTAALAFILLLRALAAWALPM